MGTTKKTARKPPAKASKQVRREVIRGPRLRVDVKDTLIAKKLLKTLAQYDLFQFENKIKPDYCNTGGLEQWSAADGGEWFEWHDDDGDDIWGRST